MHKKTGQQEKQLRLHLPPFITHEPFETGQSGQYVLRVVGRESTDRSKNREPSHSDARLVALHGDQGVVHVVFFQVLIENPQLHLKVDKVSKARCVHRYLSTRFLQCSQNTHVAQGSLLRESVHKIAQKLMFSNGFHQNRTQRRQAHVDQELLGQERICLLQQCTQLLEEIKDALKDRTRRRELTEWWTEERPHTPKFSWRPTHAVHQDVRLIRQPVEHTNHQILWYQRTALLHERDDNVFPRIQRLHHTGFVLQHRQHHRAHQLDSWLDHARITEAWCRRPHHVSASGRLSAAHRGGGAAVPVS
mmetsp:Transcript_6036/g.16918  ORF Transcript_6036/g.16918 Transcript_6036/m.16918 type:complete len:305 (-) Transcript_6036:781-1695(-)